MKFWSWLRLLLHGLTFGAVALVLLKSIFDPALARREPPFLALPHILNIPGWQQIDREPLAKLPQPLKMTSGQRYRLRQDQKTLEIEARFIVDANGDIPTYVRYTVTNSPAKWLVREQAGRGSYVLFSYEGQAYLSTCINPRGETTITQQQFMQNRYRYDLTPTRLGSWLLGREEVLDRRCLWTQLILPLDTPVPDATYQHLEAIWSSWSTKDLLP
ncbi:cyanoexosortase A system-associated protein [Anthocerotibacter panamensis]|uniref:cyanoexosortase A system-associated protein n=1 Tax=Anthocerotibacter panamensis TaxID=2857077 RepID=UPI001C4066EC|nr:cyanoexosortase A system-associated protein [Anthocerotibacter panamensis]